MYGVLVYIILSVFIAGLMVGRTPEYLGKKIQAFEVQMAMLTVLIFSLVILTFTAISSVSPDFGTSSIFNPGPHGLSEMLYAYSSAAANNGSAFGGISVNTNWYNTTLGLAMLFGRFFMIIPPLAIAGSLGRKKRIPASLGTFPVTTPLFTALLVGVIVIVGALTFFPALSLGPIVEHFLMQTRDRCSDGDAHGQGRSGIRSSCAGRFGIHSAKLHPRTMARNPVMFVVEIGSVLTTRQLDPGHRHRRGGDLGFELQITLWLWLTVLFANFAEAMAEGRGKAQADTLRRAKTETVAKRERQDGTHRNRAGAGAPQGRHRPVVAGRGDPGRRRHHRGRRLGGRSAITGESAPVIRESGGDRSAVTGGTRVLSDWIRVRVTVNPGETFLDRMIALVEGAERQKTPNEIALNILLAGLTIVFLIAVVTLQPFAIYSGAPQSLFVLVSLLVCLIPTTIGGLLSAIGIAGMDRLVQHNVLAMSGRAVEAAGDVHTLLLDKTGHDHARQSPGDRVHSASRHQRGHAGRRRATGVAAGRNAGRPLDRRAGEGESTGCVAASSRRSRRRSSPFTAQTRMSGVDLQVPRPAMCGGRRAG